MKKFFALLAILLATTSTTPAFAGSSELFNWTGFYVGADAGGIFARTTEDTQRVTANNVTLTPNGFEGGAHAGIRTMFGGLVVGGEANMWWSGAGDKGPIANVSPLVGQVSTRSGGSAQLQIGVPINNTLLFATGGWAYINTRGCTTDIATCDTNNNFGYKDTRMGWVIGGGLERALSANWSLRLEYLHANYGSHEIGLTAFSGPPKVIGLNDFTTDTVQLGLTYNFGL